MQGHHPGTKSTDEYLIELGHDSEALRELMNANFQSLKQALASREGEQLYLFADKLLFVILMSRFIYYLDTHRYRFDHAQPAIGNSFWNP
jgi:hypothetical protein